MATTQAFETALNSFVQGAQAIVDAHMSAYHPTLSRRTLSVEPGRRYARVVKNDGGVYCFVDITNGDILKAANWKQPAKHARGSI